MGKNSGKEMLAKVFKRLKTKNNRLKGGETNFMKKFLSVFIAVAMIFSLVASFRAPTASAAVTAISITDSNKTLNWYDPVPVFGTPGSGTPNTGTTYKVYNMGDVIHGEFETNGPGSHTLYLIDYYNNIFDTVTVYAPAAGTYSFTMGTANVDKDGIYWIVDAAPGWSMFREVYIKYNLTWGSKTLQSCAGSQTISGWITRGNGQTVLVPVDVYVAYPDNSLAGVYTIAPYSSGQFTITFPADGPDTDTLYDVGKFRVFVRDGYFTGYSPENDAIIYDVLSNIPTVTLNLKAYISPTLIYKSQAGQPVLLSLTDQNGNYITGATISGTNWTGGPFTEIAPGFYKAYINVGNVVDVRFKATVSLYGTSFTSNELMINTRDKGVYNPYVDVGTGEEYMDCDLARYVYSMLPCTIGTYITISADYWPVVDPTNWAIADFNYEVNGPVVNYEGDIYRIYEKGAISVTTSFLAYQRANKECDWPTQGYDVYNACCYTYEKTFNICEVDSCTYGGVTLSGDIVDSTTVTVGKKVDMAVSVSSAGAPTDLVCACPDYVVHMYMVSNCGVVANAFTLDTWSGTPITVSDVWYNPGNIDKSGGPDTFIDYLPIEFESTTAGAKFGDCPFSLKGVKFNFPTDTPCYYTLVIQIFGKSRTWDACGNLSEKWPLIAEINDPITVLPTVTTLSATGTIWEGQEDPDQILAGIATVIDITDPKFTLATPNWKFTLNGKTVSGVSASPTADGYRFSGICLNKAGTFKIYGWAYNATCTKKEEVTLEFTVVAPEFTVKIGLLDGAVIDNDNIITEGFVENIYVTPTDPRGLHDFSGDVWSLKVENVWNDCDLPTAIACGEPIPGECCSLHGGIAVSGYDNPCVEDDPMFDLYFVSPCGANIYIDSFKFVPPTVKVDPKEVPFTIPATATHVTFTVTDAHGHGAPGVPVTLSGNTGFGSGASGYTWTATAGITGKNGEVDWGFVPPFSGRYYVGTEFEDVCELPECWYGITGHAVLEAVYQAPVVDTTAPVVTATAPAKVSTSMVKITGKATDNVGVVSVWIGAKKADLAPDGTFEAVVELVEGANTLKVVAYDAAGNKGEATVTVTYEVKKVTVVKLTIGQDIMTVNGQAVQLDAAPEIKDGRTFLPLRAIAEIFGATVEWIPDTKGVTVTLGDNTIGLQIGNPTAVINGNVVDIVAPYIKNGRTMVPLRVIAEGLGATVEWDPIYRVVTITM